MRHLLNTLFVTSENIYLSLDGENVVATREKVALPAIPSTPCPPFSTLPIPVLPLP